MSEYYEDENEEHEPPLYRFGMWNVYRDGIERGDKVGYHYFMHFQDLKSWGKQRWIDHLSEKYWPDVEAFAAAYDRLMKINKLGA